MGVPTQHEMNDVLRKTIVNAEQELGSEEVVKLSQVMRALCIELTDFDSFYYVSFRPEGKAEFTIESPGLEPILRIATTSETLHNMCTGTMDPAKAFAMRKVKLSGIPLMKMRVGANLLDALFRCYHEVVSV